VATTIALDATIAIIVLGGYQKKGKKKREKERGNIMK